MSLIKNSRLPVSPSPCEILSLWTCVAAALCLGAGTARAQASDAHVVTVHLDAARGTELRGRATERDAWSVVCTAPCDERLDRTWLYKVDGSGPLTLAGTPDGGTARLAVTPPPSRTPGHVVIVVGGLGFIAGEGMTLTSIVGLVLHAIGQPLQTWVVPVGIAGTATEVTGVLTLVAGALYNLATRDAGHVDVTSAAPPPVPPAPAEGEPRAWLRAPGVTGVPIVGGTF